MFKFTTLHIHAYLYIYMYTYINNIYIYIFTFLNKYMYIWYVYIYICNNMCIYIYMFIMQHISMEWWWTFRLLGVTDRSWDSCWAYVGPFRGYVGDKRSTQKLHTQLLARKRWGWRLTCLAYVGACGGFVRLLGLS